MQMIWVIINEIFLWKTIELKMICDKTVWLSTIKKENWVLIWNEEFQKFEVKWFKFYKILKTHSLKTYALQTSMKCVLWNLIHNN